MLLYQPVSCLCHWQECSHQNIDWINPSFVRFALSSSDEPYDVLEGIQKEPVRIFPPSSYPKPFQSPPIVALYLTLPFTSDRKLPPSRSPRLNNAGGSPLPLHTALDLARANRSIPPPRSILRPLRYYLPSHSRSPIHLPLRPHPQRRLPHLNLPAPRTNRRPDPVAAEHAHS